MARASLAALLLVATACGHRSHDLPASETRDAGASPPAAGSFCRIVDGMCSIEDPVTGCTVFDARRVDVSRACVTSSFELVACEPGMIGGACPGRCFTQMRADGSVLTFLARCDWPSIDEDPSIRPCSADLEAAIAANGDCGS